MAKGTARRLKQMPVERVDKFLSDYGDEMYRWGRQTSKPAAHTVITLLLLFGFIAFVAGVVAVKMFGF